MILLCSILFVLPTLLFGQDYKYQGSRVILSTNNTGSSTSFYVYNPGYLAKAIYKDTLDAKNTFPEQLMESLISANNQKWIDYNTLGGMLNSKKYDKAYFNARNKMNKTKTFLELKAKYIFTFQGNEMAIIKYFYNSPDNKPTSGAYVLQKLGERWFYTSTSFTSDLALVIMRFQEEKLALILKGEKTGNAKIDEVILRLKDANGFISTAKLVNEFNNWYTNNLEILNYFKDANTW